MTSNNNTGSSGFQCTFPDDDNNECGKIYMYKGRLLSHLKLSHPDSVYDDPEQYFKIMQIPDKPQTRKEKRKRNNQQTTTLILEPVKTDMSDVSVEIIGNHQSNFHQSNVHQLNVHQSNDFKNTVEQLLFQIKTIEKRLHALEKKDKKLCIACWEYESTFALQPCGHKLLCGTCAATMLHSHPQCPFCRTKVTDIIQIWDVAMNENDDDIALI